MKQIMSNALKTLIQCERVVIPFTSWMKSALKVYVEKLMDCADREENTNLRHDAYLLLDLTESNTLKLVPLGYSLMPETSGQDCWGTGRVEWSGIIASCAPVLV